MAAAELKLQVGLDLAFFRQQLALLGTTATGYSLPINIDRLGIQEEITKLGKNISNRKYTLKITSDLTGINADVIKLQKALESVAKESVNIQVTGTGDLNPKEARKIRTALSKSILSNGGKIKIPATILAAITKDDITAFTRAAQAKLKEIALNVRTDITSSADGLDTKEVRKIRVALRNAVLSNGGKIKIPATIQPSISNDEVASFRKLVQEKFKGITVTVGVEPQVLSKGAAAQAPSKGQGKAGGYETALESLKRLNPEQLRSRAVKSLGEESRAAQQISNWVDILQANKGMGRGDKNKQLAGIREYLAKALAESVGQGIEAKLQPLRGQRAMEAPRSASNINKILDPIANFTQNPGVARRMLRMLPESQISTNVLDVASRQARYYENVPSARETQGRIKGFDPLMKALASNFSDYTRSLSTTDPWIGKIGKGIAQMVSTAAASPQAQKLLPAAGQSSASRMMRSAFAGLPPIQAPSIGQNNARLSRAATYSLNEARRALGLPLGPSSPYAPNPFAGTATVPSKTQAGGGFNLPPAGATSNYSASARRAAWAQAYQQSRFMQAPSMPTPRLPATGQTSAPTAAKGINTLITAIGDLGSKAASTAGKIQGKVKSSLQKASDFITMSSDGDRLSDISPEHRKLRFSDFHNFGMKLNAPLPMAGTMGAPPMQPPGPPGPPTPPIPPGGGRGGFGSFGGFGGAMPNVSLPGAGLVRELGDQFGYAAKQVLLFGAAYKALAFLTEFPAKVGEAVAQLQTFRNTLQSITPNADEFQKSNQFILDTVDKYNTPLQSARDGFTKLYASMAPAGFKGDDIRNIFAGISQGAATFGMSADKVDRVNYAFAQMASKGQVMSEELKGQLGDVLPGAVAIFAKAAGFEGPEAMVKFTKAMEDGRYKGEAMKQLLINVGIVMKDKFAAGAEGAAQTFQGQMNAMANATKKLYEAFVPAGNLFSSQIIAPFTSGLQVLADGFNAFFSGVAAQTAGGFALSQELEKLRPAFQGLSENVKQFLPLLQSFATTALGLSKILLEIASNPFVGYMARVYAVVLPLNIALNVMRGLWASNAIQLLVFNARVSAGTNMLSAFKSMMAATGATSSATAATIRGAFATTGVGLILVGLGLLIERFASMNQRLADIKTNALSAAQAIRGMSRAEARQEESRATRDAKALQSLLGQKNKGATAVPITDAQQQALERAGVRTGRMVMPGEMAKPGSAPEVFGYGRKAVDVTQVRSALLAREQIAREAAYRQRQIQSDEVQSQGRLPAIPAPSGTSASGSGGGARPRAAAKTPVEQILEREGARRETLKAAALDLALNKRILDAKKSGNEEEASSLEALRNVIKLRGRLAASVEFGNMLGRKEKDIVGKSLTKKQYDERRAKARQETSQADIDLSNAYIDLQKTEFANNDKILSQKQEYERTLEDIKIKNGEMTDEEIRRLEKLRQYQDILKANPSLTDLQKTDLFNAINAAPIDIIGEKLKTYRKNLDDMLNTKNQIVGIAESIGDSFGASFKGIIDGSMTAQQALASFFQNLSNYFADAVSKMIAEWLKVEAIKGLTSLLGGLGGMFGGGGGFSGFFGAGAPDAVAGGGIFSGAGPIKFANGGIAPKGFQAFATGGIVTGPTLGLVGEGRYNEAVIPLPDGKSVPVDLGGMSGGMSNAPIMVNVSVDAKGSTVEGDENRANDLGRAISVAVQSELIKQQRPGGLLASTRR